jgi:hypothetical protein
MPRRIEPSRAALADFDALYDYIARDNPRAAAQVLRTVSGISHAVFLSYASQDAEAELPTLRFEVAKITLQGS